MNWSVSNAVPGQERSAAAAAPSTLLPAATAASASGADFEFETAEALLSEAALAAACVNSLGLSALI